MNPSWFERPDWPADHELELRQALISAVVSLPNGDRLTDEDAEWKALYLLSASNWGRNEEQPHNRPASQKKTNQDLRKLNALCEKTVAHIKQMNQPAVGAYFREGSDLWTLEAKLSEAAEIAQHAFGPIEADVARGATKIAAAQVTEEAAGLFEHITGLRPTFTTNPETKEITGAWPSFVSAIFSALYIDASVEAQVRALKEKSRKK